jgi:hypothetical protein
MIWVGYRRDEKTARELLADEEGLDSLLESDDDTSSVDLDKAWHGLYWLLVRGDAPLDEAVFGGEELGEDLGYGPGRLLLSDRVKHVASALALLSTDELGTRLDPVAMARDEVYPGIWDEEDIFDTYLAPAFTRLRDFYTAAADADEAVIQTIC